MVDPSGAVRPHSVVPVRLSRLAAAAGAGGTVGDAADPGVTGVTHDSRAVRPGDLYAALPGARVHGARFAEDAAAAGAAAILTDPAGASLALDSARSGGTALPPVLAVDDPRAVLGEVAALVYGDPASALSLVGITGTNGKTTTAYLVEAGLRAAGQRTGLLGTVETRVGERVFPSVRTTPEATDLQALLAAMREEGATAVSMEVSSHALALGRVAGCRFAAVGFTGLTLDHLDFHGDLESYFAAKASLFSGRYGGRGVVVADESWGRRLVAEAGIPVAALTTGADGDAGWRLRDLGPRPGGGSRGRLVGPDGEVALEVALPGRFNALNAALAVALLVSAGVAAETAARGVAGLRAVPGRMEPVVAGQPWLAIVDYAHTPDAVERVLAEARVLAGEGRVLGVLGCGGDRDAAKRPLMGRALAEATDLAVLTSDNPRSEDPLEILAAMRAGAEAVSGAVVVVEPDRAAAIRLAAARARPGDVVVVLGKGHEQGQETATGVTPFDDRLVLAEAAREVPA